MFLCPKNRPARHTEHREVTYLPTFLYFLSYYMYDYCNRACLFGLYSRFLLCDCIFYVSNQNKCINRYKSYIDNSITIYGCDKYLIFS